MPQPQPGSKASVWSLLSTSRLNIASEMPISPDQQKQAQIALLKMAAGAQSADAELRYELAEQLVLEGEIEEGAKFYREAYAIAPLLRPASIGTAPAKARETARRTAIIAGGLIDAGVSVPAVLVAKAWSAAVLNDIDAVRRLIDFDAFFYDRTDALPLLTADFLAMLVEEIRAVMTAHHLDWTAIKQASRNSRVFDGPAGKTLAARLRKQVDAYVAGLPASNHPFVAARPENYDLTGWCVTFDRASRHISHIHPRAWASGVLYLQTDGVPPNDGRHRGWLRVGPPDDLSAKGGWDERWIEPVPRRLVIMPSYFTHETLATDNPGPRLCLAFDVMPRPSESGC